MRCPAVYPPDPTLGVTDPQMLPPPKLVSRSRNYAHRPCPLCGKSCPRDRIFTRILHDLGDPVAGRPRDFRLTYSQHHCTRASAHFEQGWQALTLAPSVACLYTSLGRLHRASHSEPIMPSIQRSGVDEIVRHFEALEDPRSTVNLQHPLVSVVVIALMAVLAGANGPTAIAKWAALKEEFLVEALDLPHGIPRKD